MIPNLNHRSLETSGVTASAEFGISSKDSAHVMGILRDQLYTDKVLAVLREYSSNAWDAHRDAGRGDLPIKVTLPTPMEPTLSIRDWGLGLSPDDVFNVFTQYGASTKRENANTIGMLGIGCKSAFAYSDSFTVTSWHGGVRRTYVAVLDVSDKGVINLVHEQPCDLETGVEVKVAVRSDDIDDFERTARNLYRYFTPRPDLNLELEAEDTVDSTLLPSGAVYRHGSGGTWVAVMGCIPYRINLRQLNNVQDCLHRMSGVIHLGIGEVHTAASREELKYSDLTKTAVIAKLDQLVDEYVAWLLKEMESTTTTPWSKRWRCVEFRQMALPIPGMSKELGESGVKLKTKPTTFRFTSGHRREEMGGTLFVHQRDRIVLCDEPKRALRYLVELCGGDIVVHKAKKATWEQAEKELAEFLEAHQLTGIPILKTSAMTYQPKHRPGGPRDMAKFKHQTFRLVPDRMHRRSTKAPSEAWDAAQDHASSADDVFVVLKGFRSEGYDLENIYLDDQRIAQALGVTLPTVYGYRILEKKPIKVEDVPGTQYCEWSKQWRKEMSERPDVKACVEDRRWAKMFSRLVWWNSQETEKTIAFLGEHLGEQHLVTAFVVEGRRRHLAVEKARDQGLVEAVQLLVKLDPDDFSGPVAEALTALTAKYPLLRTTDAIRALLDSDHIDLWCDYIKLIDKETP